MWKGAIIYKIFITIIIVSITIVVIIIIVVVVCDGNPAIDHAAK